MSNNNSPSAVDGAPASSTKGSPSRSPSPHSSLTDKRSSSLPWILHHILERQLSDELPLRIMFSFNSGQQLPTLKQAQKWWQFEPKGKLIIEFLSSLPQMIPSIENPAHEGQQSENKQIRKSELSREGDVGIDLCEVDRFMEFNHDLLFDTTSTGRSSPDRQKTQGFPPQFVQDICLKKVFLKEYRDVDFGLALTCLDYLRDLEHSRRAALREAAERLDIREDNWKSVLKEEPEAYAWVSSVQLQELAIETYYAAIFVDLRIWTMVHELQSEPFYKPNVLAMLNTLFPPSLKDMPNDRIDIKMLNRYRNTFYSHILSVEAQGTGIVKDFIDKLLNPNTKHSWPETRKNLVAYIELADKMITQAKEISGVEFFGRNSFRNSKTISDARSPFSDRPGTASSATTSIDDHMSPISNPKSPGLNSNERSTTPENHGRKKTNDLPEPGSIFEQSALGLHASLIPPPLKGSEYSILRDRTPKLSLKTQAKAPVKSTFASRIRAVSKAKLSPLALSSEALHYKRHSPTVSSPLADPRNEVNASDQQDSAVHHPIIKGPSTGSTSKVHSELSRGNGSETNTPSSANSNKNLLGDGLDFLNHPYEPLARPRLKAKASLSSILLRRKSSLDPSKSNKPNIHFLNVNNKDRSELQKKLSKQKSMDFIEKTRPKTPTARSHTWNDSPQLPESPQKRLRSRKSFSSAFTHRPSKARDVLHVRKDTISGPLFVEDDSDPYERYRLVADPRSPPAAPALPAVPPSPSRASVTDELRRFKLEMPTPQEASADDTAIDDSDDALDKEIDAKLEQILSPDFFRPTKLASDQPNKPTSPVLNISDPIILDEDEADFHANEWSRTWLIADSVAAKAGSPKPAGTPLAAFEQPRPTPKPPGSRPRQLSTVAEEPNPSPLRMRSFRGKKKETPKHVEIDISRFSKY